MKRLLLISIFLMSALCFAQQADSDVQLYNEVRQSFTNGFYPGTVSAVDKLWKNFPDSSFIHSALAYKGEALINMESYDDAISTLETAITYMHSGNSEIIRCNYLLGRAFYNQKKYARALEKFHLSCSLSLKNNEMECYAPSMLYSARAFYELEKWEEAKPLFEYVITNGKLFTNSVYGEAAQKLFICYNKTGDAQKTTALFNKFDEKDFEPSGYLALCFYYGDACVALKKNTEAYEAYSKVLESSEENPEKVNVFLLRLAADEFAAGEYEKADNYLSKIEISEYSDDKNLKLLKNLYSAKILLEQGKPSEAEKKLTGLESTAKKSEIEGAADSYYSTLLQCKIQGEKWDDIPAVYAKLKEPGEADRLAVSSYYYRKGQFDKVDSSCGELYASALCKLGRYEAACAEYEKLGSVSQDYVLALFRCGRYDDAIKIADAGNSVQKDYLAGLCLINQRSWKKAVDRFASYIRQTSGREEFNTMAHYYKGYAEYNLAEFKNSYSSFVRYCMDSQEEKASGASKKSSNSKAYILRAYEYAVKSALQSGDFKNASAQAANLVRNSQEGEQKQKAVLLSAEILVDYGNYDAAIELLAPYTAGRDNFAAQSLFMTARIYERQEKVAAADDYYRRIYEELPRSSYAEEAMYRVGELYYSHGDYAQAYSRFNNYVYKHSSGKFSDAAFYYYGDCALRLGENDRCVMLNKTLLQKYATSVYAYGANKNLLEAYYRQEDYSQALEVARALLRDFPVQAADDEIAKRVSELEKIVRGTDRRVAEKESEYNKLGGLSTVAGRATPRESVTLWSMLAAKLW